MSEKCPKNVQESLRGAENIIFGHSLDYFCLFGRCFCLVTLSIARPLQAWTHFTQPCRVCSQLFWFCRQVPLSSAGSTILVLSRGSFSEADIRCSETCCPARGVKVQWHVPSAKAEANRRLQQLLQEVAMLIATALLEGLLKGSPHKLGYLLPALSHAPLPPSSLTL